MMLGWLFAALFLASTAYFVHRHRRLEREVGEVTKILKQNDSSQSALFFSQESSIESLLAEINRVVEETRTLDRRFNRLDSNLKRSLTNISHDLKTPLTVIGGYSEVLQRNFDDYQKAEVLEKIKKMGQQSDKLMETITNFFDLNKLNAGELLLTKKKIDLTEILREELLLHYELLQDQWQLDIEIPEAPFFILADELALRRIFSNLLSNALKYGSDGQFLAVKTWQNQQQVFVEISDKGQGILEENQVKIFERLTTLNGGHEIHYKGSGLGLTITKYLTEAQAGTIQLYSQPFVRTTFTLTFPLA